MIEKADADFTLTNTTLTGLGTDQLDSIEIISIIAGNGNNRLDASAFTGDVTLSGRGGRHKAANAARSCGDRNRTRV